MTSLRVAELGTAEGKRHAVILPAFMPPRASFQMLVADCNRSPQRRESVVLVAHAADDIAHHFRSFAVIAGIDLALNVFRISGGTIFGINGRWNAQAGTPLNVLQELGGWESVEMVRRYAHLSGEHLSEYAKSMTGGLRSVATNRLRSEGLGSRIKAKFLK